MSDQVNKAYQATPAATLEQQIMDPNFPKNEREWWAADRIEQLEADNTRLRIENIQMRAALGYAICAEDERHIIPSNPFKCGVCHARSVRAILFRHNDG